MIPSKALPVLYQVVCASFCIIVVLSNILSAKMVSLCALNIPTGLLFYPLTFLLSDLVTEIFGAKKAQLMVYIALGMSLLSLGMIQIGLLLPTHDLGAQQAFQTVLGLSSLRIFASLTSYVTSQITGIQLYAIIKHWTGPKWLWLRNNGAACISQMIDTIMIDLIFLWWGLGMTLVEVAPIMAFSYAYKTLFSIACTPLFYLFVLLIRPTDNPSALSSAQ